MNRLFLILLSCLALLPGVQAQPYPTTSYVISNNGRDLVRWTGPETEIDFSKDPALANISWIERQAFPSTVKKITLPYRYSETQDLALAFVSPGTLEHLGWEDDREAAERLEEDRHYLHFSHGGEVLYLYFRGLKSLYIPRQAKLGISDDGNILLVDDPFPAFERIDVSRHHTLYSSEKGILFDKQKKLLIRFPSTRTGHYELENRVEKISDYAFARSQLSSIAVSPNVSRIPVGCFNRASQLQTVLLPSTLKTIASNAFSRCFQLKTIPLPAQMDSLNGFAFCTALPKTIKLPASLSYVSGSAYVGSSVENFVIDSQNPHYSTIEGVLCTKDGNTLVSYPAGRKHKNVTIPEHITRIGKGAFFWQDSLTHIYLPEGLEEIHENALGRCFNLQEVVIPATVKKIERGAFSWTNLKSITFLNSFAYTETFQQSEYLFKKVEENRSLPRRVISHVEIPFSLNWPQGDVRSDTLYVPTEGIELYRIAQGWRHFGTIRSIDELPKPKVLPFQLSYDKRTLLRWVGEEQEVNFNNYPELQDVRTIAAGAFANNSNLRHIIAPLVETIAPAESNEKGAFEQCSQLISVEMPQLRSMGNAAFYECSRLRTFSLPNLENIGMSAVAYCIALENLELPRIVTIEGYSFNSCTNLRTVTLPSSLQTIGDYAFSFCRSLQRIALSATEPPTLGFDVWGGVETSQVDLNVPQNAISLYRSLNQWKKFRFRNDEHSSILSNRINTTKPLLIFDLIGRRQIISGYKQLQILETGKKRFNTGR